MKAKAKYFLVVAAGFFAYHLLLLINSFSAIHRIYLRVFSGSSANNPFWPLAWFFSEFVGEIGLIVRFGGACFLAAFLVLLLAKRRFLRSFLAKAVLLEGAYYLFILPFIIYLFMRPYPSATAQMVGMEAGLSYALQLVLVSPWCFLLYKKLSKQDFEVPKVLKWGAVVAVGFTFALWVKHFLMNLYALPIDLNNNVLLVGFLNSSLTLLVAACLLFVALLPLIRRKGTGFNATVAGSGLVLIGVYFLVYVWVATLNQGYMSFLGLTEIWAVSMPIAGVGLILKEKRPALNV